MNAPVTNDPEQNAKATYDAASDLFDHPALAFWNKYGQATVERIALTSGARVVDVCCGTGASALPAAEQVGPEGRVIAVDLSEELLSLGRKKAVSRGLRNIEFVQGDMQDLPYPHHHFDAVVCVFGIFFVADMESQIAKLWHMVRPGGKIAITTWGPRIFSPAYEFWLEEVRAVRPDLHSAFRPWDRITTPSAVERLFQDAGIGGVHVVPEHGWQPLESPEDFWTIALGSGLRWTIDKLGTHAAEKVKQSVLSRIAATEVEAIETNVIYAVATRAAPAA